MTITQNDKKLHRVNCMRNAIDALKDAKDEYIEADMHVEALAVEAIIVNRLRQYNFYIAKNFPITEVKQ